MATIDLTTPEPDLIKVRLLAQQLLDLVQPPDDDNGDDAPPTTTMLPPPTTIK